MKKKVLIGSLAFLLASCAGVVAGNLENQNEQKRLTREKSQLAFDATTSLSMLNHIQKNTRMLRSETNVPTQEDILQLQDILHQIDLILLNDSNFEIESQISDKDEYKSKDIVTFKNYNNEEVSYTLYYSEVREKIKEDIFDDEVETKVSINGVALVDNQEYRFKSVTKTEKEGKEIEEEYSFTLYKDNDSYIKIIQEYEEERDEVEKYYRYQVVENGVKVYDYLLDYEKENGHKNETEIRLTLDNRKYKIEEIQQKDGNYLQVQVIETNSLESRSTYKVLFKKVISESGVSYELVG